MILRAVGGNGALAGTGVRSTSDLIRASTMLMASAWEQHHNMLYLLGAGWESVSVTNLGDPVAVCMAMTFECAGVEPGEYSIILRATGPTGGQSKVVFPLTVEERGDILRISRVTQLHFLINAYGLWTLTAEHDGRLLGAVDLNVKRTGEI